MSLFEKKVKGKPAVFVVEIKSAVPYPDEDTRKKQYFGPLSSIFFEFFDDVLLHYHKGEKNRLTGMDVACFEPKFSYKKSEEIEFYPILFQKISALVLGFFAAMGVEARIVNIFLPTVSSLDYSTELIKAKIERKPFSEFIKKTWKPFPLPKAKYTSKEFAPFFDTDCCPYCGENLRGKNELHLVGSKSDIKKYAQEVIKIFSPRVWVDPADPIATKVKGTLVLKDKNKKSRLLVLHPKP